MSSTTSKKTADLLRRRQFTATKIVVVPSVPNLMDELREAEIRARIGRARKEAGLTQEELAALLEVIPRTVQNYESKRGHVPWARMSEIAELTGRSVRWLLHGEEEPPTGVSDISRTEARLKRIEDKLDRVLAATGSDGIPLPTVGQVDAVEHQLAEFREALDEIQATLDNDQARSRQASATSGRSRLRKPA